MATPKTEHLTIHTTPEIKESLRVLAKQTHRSMSEIARAAIRDLIATEQTKRG